MIAAKTKYIKIKNPETGEFEALISIKGDKGDLGGLSNITGEYGDSEELAASQALVSKLDAYTTEFAAETELTLQGHSLDISTLMDRVSALEGLDISTHLSTLYEGLSSMQTRIEELETATFIANEESLLSEINSINTQLDSIEQRLAALEETT